MSEKQTPAQMRARIKELEDVGKSLLGIYRVRKQIDHKFTIPEGEVKFECPSVMSRKSFDIVFGEWMSLVEKSLEMQVSDEAAGESKTVVETAVRAVGAPDPE